ncbi:MAG TPA: histidine kinase [Burkholderiaceae bacterium]|nr:histidine kinase [Burkholderiaceae bacterium]
MTQSVLGSLTLGYRPLWNRSRELAGLQLFVDSDQASLVDAPHLLRTLQELWSEIAPPLLLSIQSPAMLRDLLAHAPANAPWMEIRAEWLADAAMQTQVLAAHARGLRLVWRGELGDVPQAEVAHCFERGLLSLPPEQAALALRAAQQRGAEQAATTVASPILADQIYERIPNCVLMEHCLDQQGAWGLAGWPMEDVLHGRRNRQLAPGRRTLTRLIRAVDSDQSAEVVEQILSEEPVLAYRFLMHINSAAIGLRDGIESLRHGLMMMGYTSLGKWLVQQLPHATEDLNLEPIRMAMVLRAQLTDHLLDAGIDDELRREVYLSGLFSQLDLLMDEPLHVLLRRVPLSERIYNANITASGPYFPSLELARAMETEDSAHIRALCQTHDLSQEEVNRALLRTLADLQAGQSST